MPQKFSPFENGGCPVLRHFKQLIFHLYQMEKLWNYDIPVFKHIRVDPYWIVYGIQGRTHKVTNLSFKNCRKKARSSAHTSITLHIETSCSPT